MEKYTFIIQKATDKIDTDTATLIEQLNYFYWLDRENTPYSYQLVKGVDSFIYREGIEKNIKYYIPVGTIEFVEQFIDRFNLPKNNFKEIYEPTIQKHLKIVELRDIYYNLQLGNRLFVKEMGKFKTGFADIYGYIFDESSMHYLSNEKYYCSKVFDILSEYRLFITNKKIVGIQNYSGDILEFPTKEDIIICKSIIKDYNKGGLTSYTLDIALTTEGMKVLEIHPFFSCGLYGFNEKEIPNMYIEGFKYLTRK